MDAITHILSSANERIYCNEEKLTSTGAKLWRMPANSPEYGAWASQVTFIIRIKAVGGGPTKWSLGAKFVYEIPHTENEQFFLPTESDLDSTAVVTDIFEGVPWALTKRSGDTGLEPQEGGYGVIATDASVLPLTIKRTITNFGRDVAIKLDPWAEGGTNPYINATVLAVPQS